MSEVLVNVTRSGIVESIYSGDIVVVNAQGKILVQKGDPMKFTYWRSAAKPVQALNVFLSGAFEKYKFTKKEIAVICSSHYGEDPHLEAVRSILKKIGADESYFRGGLATSLKTEYALELASKGITPSAILSDCSGKHSGMLAVCKHKGYSTSDYLAPEHKCQQEILEAISYMCQIDKKDIKIGIDGCSAPVHAMPLYNMALSYARFANPTDISDNYKNACTLIFDAMTSEPFMISGTDGFCTNLIKNTNKKLIGKVGAEGVYCIGVKDKNIGIAVKIESGSMAVLPVVVMKILNYLGLLTNEENIALSKYIKIENKNDNNLTVGFVETAFEF